MTRTPLGVVEFSATVGGSKAASPAHVAFRHRVAGDVLRWDFPEVRAELLVAPLSLRLPGGMAIQGGVAAFWRVAAQAPISECVFDARWSSEAAPPHGGPSSGQHLAASTWENGRTAVSIGAPDAERLGHYKQVGLALPAAWRALVTVEDPGGVLIEEYLPDGLGLRLPALDPGEIGQVHFVVAWADAATQKDAPWFAVDLSPVQLSEYLNQAV